MIIGGFPKDSDRADIEATLRDIMRKYEGVEQVSSLGKYGQCGRVYFTGKEVRWEFIKDKKGNKFPYAGVPRSLWFSIEETPEERAVSGKVGGVVRALVAHLVDKGRGSSH